MKQYVVIARDGNDADALNRRLNVRDAHLTGARNLKDNNQFIIGGAMLNSDGNMCGSVLVLQFETDDAFEEWYKNEPYIVNGVWQVVEVLPFKVANI